jgi:hypothetical protein
MQRIRCKSVAVTACESQELFTWTVSDTKLGQKLRKMHEGIAVATKWTMASGFRVARSSQARLRTEV